MATEPSASPSKGKTHVFLKISLALLPTLVFTQAYAWMTLNRSIGLAFLLIWALVIVSLWQLDKKNHIIVRAIRLLEIGFFFLPISTIILTFALGSSLASSMSSNAGKGAAALGAGIGGFFITILAFIIGIAGGIITHLIGNSYSKKAESEHETKTTFLAQHGIPVTLAGLFLITLIVPHFSPSPLKDASVAKTTNSTTTVAVTAPSDTAASSSALEQPATPPPLDITNVTISRDIINQPEANLTVTNKTKKKVIALKVKLLIYTKFDEPVKNSFSFTDDSNEFIGISQDHNILPGGRTDLTWQLTGFDGAGKAKASLYQVKFDDDTEWKAADFKE